MDERKTWDEWEGAAMSEDNRTVQCGRGRIPTLDDALIWIVQTIDREHLTDPHVLIEPYWVQWDDDPTADVDPDRTTYQASVSGKQAPRPTEGSAT